MLKTTLLFIACLPLAATAVSQEGGKSTGRWAKEMAAFAKQDTQQPTPKGGVVFVGSSSIRKWKLEKSFPEMVPAPLNRGFGGSQLKDSIRNAELLVTKHKPRVVVVYAGDNDIAGGKTPERVADDFAKLADVIKKELPETTVAYIAIKPSTKRWELADKMQQANALIAKQCAGDEQLKFIDVWKPMLGDDGKPRPELLGKDGLHLSNEGYKLWASLVEPVIKQASGQVEQATRLKDRRENEEREE